MHFFFVIVVMKKKVDTPESRETDDYKHNAASRGQLPAEDPTDDVEPENSNGSPVQTSDNQDGKSDFIQKKFPLSDVAFPEREEI